MDYKIEPIKLDLKVNWKISRNESLSKENFVLTKGSYSSEIAPNIRYDETSKLIHSHFKELAKATEMKYHWCSSFQSAINNVLLKERFAGDLFKALDLPRVDEVETSFSIPIMDLSEVSSYLKENNQYHFYKLKVSDSESFELLEEVSKHTDKPIRIDANEGFKSLEDYLEFESKLSPFNIQFIEQPFTVSMIEEYQKLRPISKYEIIADESVLLDFNGERFQSMFHGINVKNMKARGLENSKRLLIKAREFGMKTMIGCMIESSLGISEAMSLVSLCDYVDLDGSLLLKNDPYKDLIVVEKGRLSLA